MALTQVTTTTDASGAVVETHERKLYTLAELNRDTVDVDEDVASDAYEKALDWLREGQFDDSWWSETVLDNDAVELFKACGITVPQKTETIHVKVDGKFQWDEHNKPITKTITRDDTIWDSWDIERREFTINDRARVDERQFLRALQWWLAGKDIRDLPALRWGQPTPPRPLTASPRQQRKFDLRSKDARIIREQGLVIQRVSRMWGGSTREFDLDYHYDGLSQQTMDDCNELLSDLCHEVLSLLQDEMDYQGSEEALRELAEANEYTFDRNGRRAN